MAPGIANQTSHDIEKLHRAACAKREVFTRKCAGKKILSHQKLFSFSLDV
jgi:hypothetical protein